MPIAIDLQFLGHPRVIAAAVLAAEAGIALVDPGPASCLPALEAGLQAHGYGLGDVRAVLLTHIHLDHAGAAGSLVRRLPGLEVHVHERGARHLADPAKLLASATRLYGADMERLWGEFLPVPAGNLRALQGGETIAWRGRRLEVAYTPGHASHHVSYLDTADGTAYVGDTAGVRVSGDYVLAPTPPPDIDVELWRESLERIREWSPVRLFLTHFGESGPAAVHLARCGEALQRSAEAVRATLAEPGGDADRIATFVGGLREDIRRALPEHEARAAELAAPFDQLWLGLARYWRKREGEGPSPGTA
jgi:glyoxylase-like metal-dependent hydrolase (beta-lactamase superfamily II)